MEDLKSILVKVPMETYLRMKKVQTKRLLEALHNNGDKKVRLDLMVLEAIEEKYAEKIVESKVIMALTLQRLNEVLECRPTTNTWHWKTRTAYRIQINAVAGTLNKGNRKIYVRIDRRNYSTDALLFLLQNGAPPPKYVPVTPQKKCSTNRFTSQGSTVI